MVTPTPKPPITLGLLCLALLAPARADAQSREVLLLGSSSVSGASGRTIDDELGTWGFDVTRRPRGATGFARPDFFDWQAEVPAMAPLDRYALVIVMVGGNDVQSLRQGDGWIRWQREQEWTDEYAARVTHFVDELCRHGAPRVAVLLPVDGGRPVWTDRIDRVRHAQALGARASRCGVALDPGDDQFPARDGVHLSWRGARQMWGRIEEAMRVLLNQDET